MKGKVINLNAVGLAKIWYLATVIPIPPWLSENINEIIFSYLWGENKSEPIGRETVFLPKEKGGLGLLQPTTHSLAIRTKYLQHVVNPSETAKWVYTTRYWIGFQIGRLNPVWEHLRKNHLPKPDRDLFPEYWADCLHLIKNINIQTLKWNSSDIRKIIQTKNYVEPNAQPLWRKLGKQDTKWDNTWKGIYTTQAEGKHQDVHYKFIHMALYTNQNLSRFKGSTQHPLCDFCKTKNKEVTETHIHVIRQCQNSHLLWNRMFPLLRKILKEKRIRVIQILFNTFPAGVPTAAQKIALTVAQVTSHKIWTNRNNFKHQNIIPDLDISQKQILHALANIIKANYNKRKREKALQRFQSDFCVHPDFCYLENGKLHIPFNANSEPPSYLGT